MFYHILVDEESDAGSISESESEEEDEKDDKEQESEYSYSDSMSDDSETEKPKWREKIMHSVSIFQPSPGRRTFGICHEFTVEIKFY